MGIPAPTVLFGGRLTATLLFSLQAAPTKPHAQGQGAVRFLESQWLTQPGRDVPFWPEPRN